MIDTERLETIQINILFHKISWDIHCSDLNLDVDSMFELWNIYLIMIFISYIDIDFKIER